MTPYESNLQAQARSSDEVFDSSESCASSSECESGAAALAIGSQLRSAREALGLSLEDAGRKLCLPARVLRQLEADDFTGIDSPIYLRGYLRSYSGLLGVDLPAIPEAEEKLTVRPLPLSTTGGVSHGRFLLQRYALASTYLVITALIVVPIVVLGLNGGLQRDFARLAPLDVAPSSSSVLADATPGMPAAEVKTVAPLPAAERPLRASMAPFLLLDSGQGSAVADDVIEAKGAEASAGPVALAGADSRLSIALAAPSWVEVTDAAGTRLEYALLPAGEYRYSSELTLEVLLGDSAAATVTWDGEKLDLAPFQHGNRARFEVNTVSGAVTEPDNA